MKTLYLLRHAKAESGTKDISDPDRILAPRGREACEIMGAYMKSKKYTPALALVSPSARTRETFQRIAEVLGALRQRQEEKLYLAGAEQIIRFVQKADDTIASLMVVGHNPGMHHAALLLSEPEHTKLRLALELKYPTCALAVLGFEEKHWGDVSAGRGRVLDFVTPDDL